MFHYKETMWIQLDNPRPSHITWIQFWREERVDSAAGQQNANIPNLQQNWHNKAIKSINYKVLFYWLATIVNW